jgi:hypothetical protein
MATFCLVPSEDLDGKGKESGANYERKRLEYLPRKICDTGINVLLTNSIVAPSRVVAEAPEHEASWRPKRVDRWLPPKTER